MLKILKWIVIFVIVAVAMFIFINWFTLNAEQQIETKRQIIDLKDTPLSEVIQESYKDSVQPKVQGILEPIKNFFSQIWESLFGSNA